VLCLERDGKRECLGVKEVKGGFCGVLCVYMRRVETDMLAFFCSYLSLFYFVAYTNEIKVVDYSKLEAASFGPRCIV
jgi:hypothetical protein